MEDETAKICLGRLGSPCSLHCCTPGGPRARERRCNDAEFRLPTRCPAKNCSSPALPDCVYTTHVSAAWLRCLPLLHCSHRRRPVPPPPVQRRRTAEQPRDDDDDIYLLQTRPQCRERGKVHLLQTARDLLPQFSSFRRLGLFAHALRPLPLPLCKSGAEPNEFSAQLQRPSIDSGSTVASDDAWDDMDADTPVQPMSPSELEAGVNMLFERNSSLAKLQPPTLPQMPSGASTPVLSSTSTLDGNPIVSYPPPPATWTNMPHKDQLAILAFSRFVDFFQMASLQTYMVHQLKSFDHSLPDSVISHQSGILQGAFTAAQIITSIIWGRVADQPNVGRKMVLNIGLIGTGISCVGVGFSTTFGQAVAWRILGGAVNGTVGAARTMVAETVDKRWHSRAFLLLPVAFNFANMLGPILGSLLVDPLESYPRLFGPNSTFGGKDGVHWLGHNPYALANLLSTALLFLEAAVVALYLRETLHSGREMAVSRFDPIQLCKSVYSRVVTSRNAGYAIVDAGQSNSLLAGRDETSIELPRLKTEVMMEQDAPRVPQILPFGKIWTSNVLWTLLSIAIFDFHMGAFANLWILFLSTSRVFVPTDPPFAEATPLLPPPMTPDDAATQAIRIRSTPHPARSAFKFSGGLAFPP
ncbi:hypothetical protein LTR28_013253, partial [Elasticomyces elasticus]